MNKKELAKLVYNHPIVKNLYKSSDKTVINKLIAEEVLKEASSDRLNQLQKDLKFFQEEIKALEKEFAQAKNKQEAREIRADITKFLGVIADLEKKISVLQKVQEPSQEAVQAVQAIVADEKKNIEDTKEAVKSLDKAKLKALAAKFLQYNKRLTDLKDLEAKVGTLASIKEPNQLLKAIGELLSSGKQQQITPTLKVNNPDEKAKAAIVPSLVVVANSVGVDAGGIQEIEAKAKEIKNIDQIPAYNEFAFQIMKPFFEQNLKKGKTFDEFKQEVTQVLEKQLPALIQKEQQPQQDQAKAGEEERATLDQARKELISKATIFNKQLPKELIDLPFIDDAVFKIWLGSKIDKAGVMREQEEQVEFSAEDVKQGILTTQEVKELNDILKNNKEQISKIIKLIPSYSGAKATSKGQQQLTKIDTPTDQGAKTTEPSAEPEAAPETAGETEEPEVEPEEQIVSTEQAAQRTTEAAKEDAKVQKPVQIEEFKPIMNFMNDFFLDPSNPQVAGFMENVLLKYQSKQLYKFIAHLDTILSPEFQQAFTDTSNAEKPEPSEEDGEEQTSATPTATPASTPSAAPVTSVEQPKISEGILGNLFGSKNKEEQATVQIPKKNRAALREELLTLVDLLKYLKLVVSNYEKNSTKTSIFNSYKGSSMKKVMDDLMNQVQSNLSYIMNEIQNARTAAETEQSKDMQVTAAASKEQEIQEQIYNKVLKLLKEADATSEDQTRKANVDFVKNVYEEMRGLYKSAMKTGLETLVKGGSAEDLRKLIDNAKEMKGYATEEKFISLFPTGQLVSGNVVTISDGLKALEQSIEGFIGLARDVATIVKSGEPIPSTQLTEAEYKIVDLATAIQENFGIKSKIDQAIMTKIKAGLRKDPEQTPLTDTPSEEKEQRTVQPVSSPATEAQPEVTPSPEEATDTSTEVPQQEISPSDEEIKRSLQKMKFDSKSLQFYLKPIKEALNPIFGEEQQTLQNKFLGLLFLQFHPELLEQEQIKEEKRKENEGSFKSRIKYFYPRIIKTASKILTKEEANFIKENQEKIIDALTKNEALIAGKIEDTSSNSIYSFLSKQLGKKEENLEEKLKPIIEKMLRQKFKL